MGFWKTLFRVCSGRDVFLQLLDCRFGRALLHLVFLILLLAFCLAWGHSCRFSPQLRRMTGSLFDETGSIRFVPDKGIRTANRPEMKQSYLLDHGIRVDYYPGSTLTEADTGAWTGAGIVVMDKGMAVWLEDPAGKGSGQYWIMPVPIDRGAAVMPPRDAAQKGMPAILFWSMEWEEASMMTAFTPAALMAARERCNCTHPGVVRGAGSQCPGQR